MLLYALLHLAGVARLDGHGRPTNAPAVSLEDIKNFRELGWVCAGHPEYGLATGVETTTGPLGQGAGNSVGMAIAQKWLASRYNRPGATAFRLQRLCPLQRWRPDGRRGQRGGVDRRPPAALQPLLDLGRQHRDIEGHTELAFDEDVAERFRGYGWATRVVDDANDCEAFARAVESFLATDDRPTLIVVKSVIGYGSPHKQGTSKAHSDPLARRR